jgi:formylglycine-generating enzyme required for sulfatase activity
LAFRCRFCFVFNSTHSPPRFINPNRASLTLSRAAYCFENPYTFPHRTFQEFMAACHLVGLKDYPGEASRLVRGDLTRWREVFVLAAGHAARTHRLVQAISAVNALCPEGPEKMKHVSELSAAAYRRAQLAGESLLEIGMIGVRREETGQAMLARVQDWLMAAMRADTVLEPKERAAAGGTLGRLGDPRFRADAWYLPNEPLLGFVEIPEGSFVMGSEAREREQPQHELTLPTYYIARYPVTVAQFPAFVKDSNFQPGDADSLRGVDNHPVVRVSWHEALAYCDWLTQRLREWKKTPEPLRTLLREEGWVVTLPSEAKWEKAARGSEGKRRYPWGDDPDPNRANYRDTGIGTTSAVGCFPGGASPCGAEDLSGNVWEWTRSLWGEDWQEPDFDYPYDSEDGREDLEAGDDVVRVVRGGAFNLSSRGVRCAYRNLRIPHSRLDYLGFRVVVSPFRRAQHGDTSGI